MRSLLLFALILIGYSASSQIIEVPMLNNPGLPVCNQNPKEKQTSWKLNKLSTRADDVITTCILPGKTVLKVVDTIASFGGVIQISAFPKTGSVVLKADSLYLYYTAPNGITFQKDTVIINVCNKDTTKCREILYEFIIARPGTKTTLPDINIQEKESISLKIPVQQLPAQLGSLNLITKYNNPYSVAYINGGDTAFVFTSVRGSFESEYTVTACDIYCTCDTFIIKASAHGDTLNLPFMDDFSYPGPYPDPNKWIDDDVFINNNLAVLPPSIGFASFDGLNKRGAPYGGGTGRSDNLTSRQIDLSSYSIDNNVWLSFYIEPKGLVKAPGLLDSFRVEFKDKTGKWTSVHSFVYPNSINLSPDSFTFMRVQVLNPDYLFKGFQFRFSNNSDNTGLLDLWHLDYVILNANVVPDGVFPDVAFTQEPDDLLKNYSAMPIRQFVNFETQELNIDGNKLLLTIDMNNHFNQTVTVDPSTLRIYDKESGTNIVNGITLLEVPPAAPENQKNIDPGNRHLDAFKDIPGFVNDVKNVTNDKKDHILVTEYSFDQSSEPTDIESVKSNNKVSQETVLSNYFAYDDGTAEGALGVKKTGSGAAVKFHTNVNDTLRAIQFHFPHVVNDISKQFMNVQVWLDLNKNPIHIDYTIKPFYTEHIKDSLQGFTTYVLMNEDLTHPEPVFIPAGDFYIGWIQGTNDDLPITVGFDRNSPEAAVNNFVNVSNGWQSLASLGTLDFQGSFMLRAVLGDKTPNNTPDIVSTGDEAYSKVKVYPNPASHELWISNEETGLELNSIEILSMVGVNYYKSGFTNQIDISNLPDGLYILKLSDNTGTKRIIRKLLIQH